MINEYPKIEAYIWWCGDDECDCNQPLIEVVEKKMGLIATYPRRALWSGSYICNPSSEEYQQLRIELREACKLRGIECSV